MPKSISIETLLKNGSAEWNKLRQQGKVGQDHTGATFTQLYSANADLSGLQLVGTEWEKCDLSKLNFKEADLSNAYFHGGRLSECDFRGANLEGANFENMKLWKCDFTGAQGLDDVDFEDVDLDRCQGLEEDESPPKPPAPQVGVTSFTKEQRTAQLSEQLAEASESPTEFLPFRPQDSAATLLGRLLRALGTTPVWTLDVPGLKLPLPARLTPGSQLESLVRDCVKSRMEGRKPVADSGAVERAQTALRLGNKDAAFAALYLKEVATKPRFRFAAAVGLRRALKADLDVDDLTAQVDPRVTGALLELRLTQDIAEPLGEVRRRLAAAQLFTALLEAGFQPDTNWEEAIEGTEGALDLAVLAFAADKTQRAEAFSIFAALPEEVRARRLAYLAEALAHLEMLQRLPAALEPTWVQAPEYRECHDQEMNFVNSLSAQDIPVKAAALAEGELGIPQGEMPEDSEHDLFLHFRCEACGKEKLVVQSP